MSARGYGLALIGVAAYLAWLQRDVRPGFVLINGLLAGWFFLVGLLLWFRFRWSPELYLTSCVLMIGLPIVLIALSGSNTQRLMMILGGAIAAIAYPDLRRELRGKITSDLGD